MNRTFLGALLTLAGCSASAPPVSSRLASPATDAAAPPTAARFDLRPYQQGGHRSVSVTVGDRTMPFLFDTGGGITLVGPELAEAASCRPSGRLVGFRMRGERVDFPRCEGVTLGVGGHSLTPGSVGVFDLSALLPEGWPRLGGLLALSSFGQEVVRLDLKGGRVELLEKLDATGTAYNVVQQASGYSYVVLVPIDTPRGRLWFELDSGSDAPLIVAPHAAEMLGVDLEGADVTHHVEEGKPEWWGIERVQLTLPDVGPVTTEAKAMDIIYDGNIGAPLMERFVWTIDLGEQRLAIRPREEP